MASCVQDQCSSLDDLVAIDVKASELGVFISYTLAWSSSAPSHNLDEEVLRLLSYLRSKYTLENLKNDPVVRAYRDFYWRIGVDPTKTRPSSEALVRRALKGLFPRINPVVDAGNIASAYTMVPIGIYDLAYAKPPFKLVMSRGGEVFKPIGGGEEHLPAGIPILVDSRGLVMHVYPHRDSVETMVRESTSIVLIIGAGVPGVPRNLVRDAVELTAKLLEKVGWNWCRRAATK